jgi:dienelactone hydrolase
LINGEQEPEGIGVTNGKTEQYGNVPDTGSAVRQRAVLTVLEASGPTKGVALVLHGGKSHSFEAVEAWQLSPLRMVPLARHLHRAGKNHGLAVWSLRNSVRGWNGQDMSALKDARWALQQISMKHPGLPVYLVGHSMGGLTAVCAAGHPQVEAVVALAPWLNPGTPAASVAGRKVLIVHGTGDRMTSAAESLKFARRAAEDAASMQYVSLKAAGHFMIRRVRVWQALSTGFVMKAFCERTGFSHPASQALDELLPESCVQVTL